MQNQTQLKIKKENTKVGFSYVEPFCMHSTYVIFSFECPLFHLDVCGYTNVGYGLKSAPVVIPEMNDIEHALYDFLDTGGVDLFEAFGNVRFYYRGDCVVTSPENYAFVHVHSSMTSFIAKFLKCYYNFHKNFNPKNYVIQL